MAAPALERMVIMTPDPNPSGSVVRSEEKDLKESSTVVSRNAREEKRNRTRRIFRGD